MTQWCSSPAWETQLEDDDNGDDDGDDDGGDDDDGDEDDDGDGEPAPSVASGQTIRDSSFPEIVNSSMNNDCSEHGIVDVIIVIMIIMLVILQWLWWFWRTMIFVGLKETPVDQIGQLAALSGEVFIVNNEEMSVAGCQ